MPATECFHGPKNAVHSGEEYRRFECVRNSPIFESFINDDSRFEGDPLIKMAIIHHQFESIHPFYDGNKRTGRIVNVLYVVNKSLLNIPILYLSNYVAQTKANYYRLLQVVRVNGDADDAWQDWVLYMLTAVATTGQQTIRMVTDIKAALLDYKHRIRKDLKFYSQNLINNLFMHPFTKIEFVEKDLGVTRLTATKYLEALTKRGLSQEDQSRKNQLIHQRVVE